MFRFIHRPQDSEATVKVEGDPRGDQTAAEIEEREGSTVQVGQPCQDKEVVERAAKEQRADREHHIRHAVSPVAVVSDIHIEPWVTDAITASLKVFRLFLSKELPVVSTDTVKPDPSQTLAAIKEESKLPDGTIDSMTVFSKLYGDLNDFTCESVMICVTDERLQAGEVSLRGGSLGSVIQVSITAIETLAAHVVENHPEFAQEFSDVNALKSVLMTRLLCHELGHTLGLPKIIFGEVHNERVGWHCIDSKTCCMRTAHEDELWVRQIMQERSEGVCFCKHCSQALQELGEQS